MWSLTILPNFVNHQIFIHKKGFILSEREEYGGFLRHFHNETSPDVLSMNESRFFQQWRMDTFVVWHHVLRTQGFTHPWHKRRTCRNVMREPLLLIYVSPQQKGGKQEVPKSFSNWFIPIHFEHSHCIQRGNSHSASCNFHPQNRSDCNSLIVAILR